MLVSSPSRYWMITGVNSSRKEEWKVPSLMLATGERKRMHDGMGRTEERGGREGWREGGRGGRREGGREERGKKEKGETDVESRSTG